MIRLAQESDLPEIVDIYNDAILHTTAVYHYAPQSLEDRLDWFREQQKRGYPVIVSQREQQIDGFATFGTFRAWPAYQYTVEHSVYVHRNFRRLGTGKALLSELIRLAEDRGYATMIAGIDASNEGSISMHRKLGFVHSGTLRRVGFKFGCWLDLAFYQLDLPEPPGPARRGNPK